MISLSPSTGSPHVVVHISPLTASSHVPSHRLSFGTSRYAYPLLITPLHHIYTIPTYHHHVQYSFRSLSLVTTPRHHSCILDHQVRLSPFVPQFDFSMLPIRSTLSHLTSSRLPLITCCLQTLYGFLLSLSLSLSLSLPLPKIPQLIF